MHFVSSIQCLSNANAVADVLLKQHFHPVPPPSAIYRVLEVSLECVPPFSNHCAAHAEEAEGRQVRVGAGLMGCLWERTHEDEDDGVDGDGEVGYVQSLHTRERLRGS